MRRQVFFVKICGSAHGAANLSVGFVYSFILSLRRALSEKTYRLFGTKVDATVTKYATAERSRLSVFHNYVSYGATFCAKPAAYTARRLDFKLFALALLARRPPKPLAEITYKL